MQSSFLQASEFVRARLRRPPQALLVLGSGLGGLADSVEDPVRIPYAEIPGFPRSTVEGHAGRLVIGRLNGVEVLVMAGRFHLYEGWSAEEVATPIRALAALGPRAMLVTNAAGGIRPGMRPGDLMIIADHLDVLWHNPLIGPLVEGEERFPDMLDPYDPKFRRIAEQTALELEIAAAPGVYAALLGPSYETPAEIRMLERLGADAVGMSTVPETLVARARGLRVLGISCITNLAAGRTLQPLTHQEVVETGERVRPILSGFVRALLPRLVSGEPTAGAER